MTRDLLIGLSFGSKKHHLLLAIGQSGDSRRMILLLPLRAERAADECIWQPLSSECNFTKILTQKIWRGILKQDALGAPNCCMTEIIFFRGRAEQDDPGW